MSYRKFLISCTLWFLSFMVFYLLLFNISIEAGQEVALFGLKCIMAILFVFILMNIYNGREFFELYIGNDIGFYSCFIYAFFYPMFFVYMIYQHYYFNKTKKHIKNNFSKEKILIGVFEKDNGVFPITVNIDWLKIPSEALKYYDAGSDESCYVRMVDRFLKYNGFGEVKDHNIKITKQVVVSKNPFLNENCKNTRELEILIKKRGLL